MKMKSNYYILVGIIHVVYNIIGVCACMCACRRVAGCIPTQYNNICYEHYNRLRSHR